MSNSLTSSNLSVGSLVLDESSPPNLHSLRVVVGFTEQGLCLTSYVVPPPWLATSPRFFVTPASALDPAPAELLAELRERVPADEWPGSALGEAAGDNPGAIYRRMQTALAEIVRVGKRPIMPGHVADYCALLNRLFPELHRAWLDRARHDCSLRAEVAGIDSSQVPALDQAAREEQELSASLRGLWTHARRLEAAGPQANLAQAQGLRRELLHWAQSAEALERAHTRSLVEAHYRDEGVPA